MGGRTPRPFTKRQSKLSTMPGLPSMNCVVRPEQSTDNGTRKKAGRSVARSLSSGTHSPPRSLRRFTTIWSEIRPAIGAPTRMCRSPSEADRKHNSHSRLLTHFSDTSRNEERAYESFVRNSIAYTLYCDAIQIPRCQMNLKSAYDSI